MTQHRLDFLLHQWESPNLTRRSNALELTRVVPLLDDLFDGRFPLASDWPALIVGAILNQNFPLDGIQNRVVRSCT